MSRFRGWIQAGATLLTNLHLPNFLKGGLYQGAGKTVCVPGLNCYSCPAASGACPIGAFQAVVGSSKFSFSYYITGFLILLGVLLGRFICGFLCPFGWFQELLHKIPTKKLSTKKLKPLTYLKYAVLLVMVFLLPAFLVNDVGMGDPFFCKYLCPQGVLEGAIPLSLANAGIRAALGKLFTWKFSILLSVIVLSVPPLCRLRRRYLRHHLGSVALCRHWMHPWIAAVYCPAARPQRRTGQGRVGVSPDSPERRKRDVSKRIGTAFHRSAAAQRLRRRAADCAEGKERTGNKHGRSGF